ncbi:1-(5-phosphoribosyl)-5-[(5-phosphoribosylamino)methylideneamino]imidazole-4-carboxamide isomerase [Pseudoxanthomonas japonensis]|jgi:phosphoribosylformimino-5-aminoimidazole carboxamide ribotide isomerase|uniref:1-(5-phosphoribosyl)-5-[(5-phosphoribosylamino)methylideneamino] imidazole-4-carboxamide isomerase n=1 Tax=Pseudoxanthomonas japonensis TaxID=69284 RepID=A0ABQ6ZFI6_9GAMM|nr:1-(5-phosphoribosyl)-5-[(5-phosphoribosylamino)methylideneamino]imidazole-4-carboxamide isomerase [Pseudoxanthomonas japonensis]KAF1724340.1 1-(5-phosphoribosyl)-5-[(5-phosphoribosylamino)methylideneamino]imidazole-4-carboxamide isomerase [Pseudoxanthomonas japonensis]NCT71905.1 1-(5-phosphoribosyl)-5-[(5-phosphoribosylamino)methylideneamino]imidazole-4-carboxamide isomerase [Xanthomonadaceae bacterium]
MTGFTVYPAIDVRDGRVVRLAQGDYARETRYEGTPLEVASRYAEQGADWLHLVDLDAARAGGYTLAPLLGEIARHTRLKVQTGGGVRQRDDVARILDAGADRVVIGSLAVREPETVLAWLAEFGSERITVALDSRRDRDGIWRLPVHGWTETASETLDELALRYADAGLHHLLCTDIARDGMLTGSNLALYAYLHDTVPSLAVQASGGVSAVADVVGARDAGCAGIVLGRALLEGRFTLPEALAC